MRRAPDGRVTPTIRHESVPGGQFAAASGAGIVDPGTRVTSAQD